MILSHFILT